MAEKPAVLIKYKYLEYVDSANLSDADSWKLMRGVIEYDKTGEVPQFENSVLYGIFAVIKLDLDQNKENYNKAVEANSNNGKKGGAPKGNQNARKNKQTTENNRPLVFPEKTTENKHDNEYDLDLEFIKENGGGKKDLSSRGEENSGLKEKPPPSILKKIISETHRLGFIIDKKKAIEFFNSGIDPSWFEGPRSFLDFAADKILNELYPKKPHRDQQNLFNNAVITWQDLRAEYPIWRQKQEEYDRQEALRIERDRVKRNPPGVCRCGARLDGDLHCPVCRGTYRFDDASWEWVYHEEQKPFSIMDGYENYLKSKRGESK
jgi:hypothetical protein